MRRIGRSRRERAEIAPRRQHRRDRRHRQQQQRRDAGRRRVLQAALPVEHHRRSGLPIDHGMPVEPLARIARRHHHEMPVIPGRHAERVDSDARGDRRPATGEDMIARSSTDCAE